MAGHEYARLNTTASITGENNGNGAQPTRGSEQGENKDNSANDRRARNAHTKRLRLGADQEQRLRGAPSDLAASCATTFHRKIVAIRLND